jgi:hypothetical protein
MTAAALAEARLALTGALLLARGDATGLRYFDQTEEGFWHSFRGAALCYPLYLVLLAFPLLMLPLVDRLQRSHRYFGFMVAYNWCQVPQTVVFALVALGAAAGLLSPQAMLVADLIVGVAVLVYEWYVARVALAVSRPQAALVIAVDILLATVLTHVSTALY